MIYYDFFKDSTEIIKKEKDKTTATIAKPLFTVAKPPSKLLQRGKLHGLKIEEDNLPDFKVEGEKVNFREN